LGGLLEGSERVLEGFLGLPESGLHQLPP
jgi:hypothetical protein